MRKSVLKRLGIVPILVFTLILAGCGPIEGTARDGIAAAKGFLDAQAAQHGECNANPNAQICQLVTKGNNVKHVVIDALEQFCSGPAFEDGSGPCQPPTDKTRKDVLESQLKSALNNLKKTISDIKALK